MYSTRLIAATCLLVGVVFGARGVEQPWYVDDEHFSKGFSEKLVALVNQKEVIRASELKKRLEPRHCRLTLAQPHDKALTPEEIYRNALPSIFVVGSVQRSKDNRDKWEDGRQATAWALTSDGVLMTNWHVFEKVGKERFGVANCKGEVFPIVDILACDPDADMAIIKVKGEGFVPLALGGDEPVGAWVSVISHPGGQLFSFTQGYITRYCRERENEKTHDWMCLSADYAAGSSGGPVLNRLGNVVGMATVTLTLESDEADAPEKPKTRRRLQEPPPKVEDKPKAKGAEKLMPQVQMVVKMAIPARVIRKLVSDE